MTLEQQVCSLELAKKLKELRCKQKSLFYWVKFKNKWIINDAITSLKDLKTNPNLEFYSAYTVAELGEMLPNMKSGKNTSSDKSDNKWICNKHSLEFYAETEADARAKMLICLIENKLT